MKIIAQIIILLLAFYGLIKLLWKPYWYILGNYPKRKYTTTDMVDEIEETFNGKELLYGDWIKIKDKYK